MLRDATRNSSKHLVLRFSGIRPAPRAIFAVRRMHVNGACNLDHGALPEESNKVCALITQKQQLSRLHTQPLFIFRSTEEKFNGATDESDQQHNVPCYIFVDESKESTHTRVPRNEGRKKRQTYTTPIAMKIVELMTNCALHMTRRMEITRECGPRHNFAFGSGSGSIQSKYWRFPDFLSWPRRRAL
jgi:hypothetical protein